jgi:hypothetical protein
LEVRSECVLVTRLVVPTIIFIKPGAAIKPSVACSTNETERSLGTKQHSDRKHSQMTAKDLEDAAMSPSSRHKHAACRWYYVHSPVLVLPCGFAIANFILTSMNASNTTFCFFFSGVGRLLYSRRGLQRSFHLTQASSHTGAPQEFTNGAKVMKYFYVAESSGHLG